MYISPNNRLKLNELLKNNRLAEYDHISSEGIIFFLKETSNIVLKLIALNKVEPGLFRYLLIIGTAFRRGSKITQNIAYGLFKTLRSFDDSNQQPSFLEVRFLIFETYNKLKNQRDFNKNIHSILWSDEILEIDKIISNSQNVDTESINKHYKRFKKHLDILNSQTNLYLDYELKLKNLFQHSKGPDADKAKLAKQGLSYFNKKDDLIDDRAGFFGLADDLYVIDYIYEILNELAISKEILSELTNENSISLSLLFERGSVNELYPLSQQIQLILAGLSHAEKTTTKVNAVVPILNSIVYIKLISDYFSETIRTEEPEEISYEIGSMRYFIMPQCAIEFEYTGECEITKKSKIRTSQDYGEFRIDQYLLKSSFSSPKSKKTIKSSFRLFNEWQSIEQNFLPPFLQINKVKFNEISILITQKKIFDELSPELKPFGIDLKGYMELSYITENSKLADLSVEKNNIFVCSSASVAAEIVFHYSSINKVYCDDAVKGSQFLSLLSNLDLEKINNLVIFSKLEDQDQIKEFDHRGFKSILFNDLISGLKEPKATLNLEDPISINEKTLFKASREILIEKHHLYDEHISKFLREYRDLCELESRESLGLQNIIFKLRKFKDIVVSSWYDLRPEQKQLKLDALNEAIGMLSNAMNMAPQILKIINLLKTQTQAFLNASYLRDRDLRMLIERSEGEPITIMAKTNIDKLNATKKNVWLALNVKIISPSELIKNFHNGLLIIPAKPGLKVMKHLMQVKVSDKLALSLFDEELKDFESFKKSSDYWKNTLNKKTARIFDNTLSSKKPNFKALFDKPIKKPTQISVDEHEDEIVAKAITVISKAHEKDETLIKACCLTLDDKTKFTFFAPSQEVFSVKSSEINTDKNLLFNSIPASIIGTGDVVCIPVYGKNNFIEEIASITNKDYEQIKAVSMKWRELLRQLWAMCNYDVYELQKELENNNVKRTVHTLQNWLHDDHTIAPNNRQFTISVLSQLAVKDNSEEKVQIILDAIQKRYEFRKRANIQIIGLLNAQKLKFGQEKINFNIQNNEFSLSIHIVSNNEVEADVPRRLLGQVQDFEEINYV